MPALPDFLTYRLGSQYVYVATAATYEVSPNPTPPYSPWYQLEIKQRALDLAKKEFPEELGHIPRERITFTVSIIRMRGAPITVRISESAWAPSVTGLRKGDFIDIEVRRGPGIGTGEGKEELPPYLDVPAAPRKSEKGGSSRLRFWKKDS